MNRLPTLAVFTLLAGCGDGPPPAPLPEPPSDSAAQADAAEAPAEPPPKPIDDGRMLWAAPPGANAFGLSTLPASGELFLIARPARLLAHPEGKRLLRSLRWGSDDLPAIVETATGKPLAATDLLSVAVDRGESFGDVEVAIGADPPLGADEPLVGQAIEELLARCSTSRDLVVIASLPWLLGEGGGLFGGLWAPLGETLRSRIDQEWRAAMLSLELVDKRLYWELRLVGGRGVAEGVRGRTLAAESRRWADDLQSFSAIANTSLYGAKLLRAAPAMITTLGRYARVGVDRGQTTANGYLPVESLHNLTLLAQLLVAEAGLPAPAEEAMVAAQPLTVEQRLAQPVTIRFTRESLETAVAILSETIGVPITIAGRDLQLQGITRNQMVGLDAADQPAADALVTLLRQANPDPDATGANDPRQALVYVVRVSPPSITITTRTAAGLRGDPLPPPFLE